jgi:predicted O-methyltransferase YrrM
MQFLERLQKNAYENLDISGHIIDIQGWMCAEFSKVFENAVKSKDRSIPLIVIEVGTWKGLSAITMANILQRLGFKNFKIICIDTWLGAPEFWTWGIDDPIRGLSLKLVNGYPSIFLTFTKNIKMLGFSNNIIPLPLSSIQAVDVLTHYKITADVIYIDAAHEYDAVKQDYLSYWPLLKSGGVILGDDYEPAWPGVIKAINEVISKPTISGIVWSTSKP